MPACIVVTTVSIAAAILGNAQMATEMASGTPCSRRVMSVMIPNVPSDPTKSFVRS